MRRLFIISMILLSGIAGTRAQTITTSDGYVTAYRTGVSYTLLPVAAGDTTVTPYGDWDGAWGWPMAFTIGAQPYEEFLVTFSTSGNTNPCSDQIPASFAADALWWVEEGRYLDPGTPQRIAMDSMGKATLGLGISFTLPPGTEGQYFEFPVDCRIIGTLTGDTITSSSTCLVDLYHGGYFSYSDLQIKNLRRGRIYSLRPGPDTFSISPPITGGETGGMDPLRIDGNAGSEVQITFVLPTELIHEGEQDRIACRFDTNAVYVEEAGRWVNPNAPVFTRLGPECFEKIRSGLTVEIPADAAPGWYFGQIIYSVVYTGNLKAGSSRPLPSEAEILISVQVLGEELPNEYSLSQNYPNPFNSNTTISYALPEASPVTLEIFDPLGREIRTLVDGTRAAGVHSEIFDAGDLPSGVYMYRLVAGKFRETRKLMHIR